MEKKDFSVGQFVYLKIVKGSNASRRISDKSNIDEWIDREVVTKVGNKYIEVNNRIKFDIKNNFREAYEYGGEDYELYLSREVLVDELISEKLCGKIKSKFSAYENNNKISLDVLKQITKLLDIAE